MVDHDDALQNYVRYRNNPWAFLTECVYTLDQVDKDNPVKLFPDMEYLKLFTFIWNKKNMIAVPKSRRMTMSWTCISLALWDVMFHKGRAWAFVSRKEDASLELLERAEFIYRHIPADKIPKDLLPKLKNNKIKSAPPELEFPELNSIIRGFPQGADQLRQYTFSGIFGDECAFWEQAQKFYSASKPTIDGGGKMILVSSRAPGFFKKIVFDQVDSDNYHFPEVAPAKVEKPINGIDIWENPKNRFTIFDCHYTAHPQKQGKEFKDYIKATVPMREYLMEYEKSWDTYEGMAVYAGTFNPNYHIARNIESPDPTLPLLLGIDFGLTPACIVGQLQGDRLVLFKEYIGEGGIKQFMPGVMNDIRMRYPNHVDLEKQFIIYCDPAGFRRADGDSSVTAMRSLRETTGIKSIMPGPVDWESRRNAVEHFMVKMDKDGACFTVDEVECPVTVSGFKGGYRYPESFRDNEPGKIKPIKDHFSHPQDCVQYICGGALLLKRHKSMHIPRPNYTFLKNNRSNAVEIGGQKWQKITSS